MSLLAKEQRETLEKIRSARTSGGCDFEEYEDIEGTKDFERLFAIIDDIQARAPNSLVEEQVKTAEKRPKMRSEEFETPKSRAVFYSILWPSMRKAAMDLGWALALHGSLENDMDIMGMPWTENCKSHQELAKAISDCLGDTIWREHHLTPHYTKPHGRISYTLSIGGSWHVDLSIMPPHQLIRKQYTEQELVMIFQKGYPQYWQGMSGDYFQRGFREALRRVGALKKGP